MVTQKMFDFFDAAQIIIDMNQDRNVTIDFNNELVTVESIAGIDYSCRPVVGQDDQEIVHIGNNVGWIVDA